MYKAWLCGKHLLKTPPRSPYLLRRFALPDINKIAVPFAIRAFFVPFLRSVSIAKPVAAQWPSAMITEGGGRVFWGSTIAFLVDCFRDGATLLPGARQNRTKSDASVASYGRRLRTVGALSRRARRANFTFRARRGEALTAHSS